MSGHTNIPSKNSGGPWLQKPLAVSLAEIDQSVSVHPTTTTTTTMTGTSSSTTTTSMIINQTPNASTNASTNASVNHSMTGLSNHDSLSSNDVLISNDEDISFSEAASASSSVASSASATSNTSLHIKTNIIERHLSLFDLVSIGVGGTIGSGIFVLCGYIAHQFAGPATCISWAIAGAAACLSGVCYAELACRMPAAGSSYVYVYASIGELPAVLVAACLSLEYGVSASAVARSWGDKSVEWLRMDFDIDLSEYIGKTTNFNPLATIVATASVFLLMGGVKESKSVTNFFTMTKVAVVVFMAIVGLMLMKPNENLKPFIPAQYGMAGIFRGATSSFFGYIGFDEVCCVAGEAINPQRNMPLSIITSLTIVTVLYIVAALALTGMQPYDEISEVSGFPVAFQSRGWGWAAQISAFGEIFTLPIVVLISLMAQPRLQYALSKDGLLPGIFSYVDDHGNIWYGTLISGILVVIIASFVPFEHLNDMISAGILVAFCMTDSSLIIMRHESDEPGKVERQVALFNISALVFGISLTHFYDYVVANLITAFSVLCMITCIKRLYQCPQATLFGGSIRASQYKGSVDMRVDSYFKTPWLPFFPCLGIFVNCYLISQLELIGIALLLGYLSAAAIFYFCYGMHHSVGANGGWEQYDITPTTTLLNSSATDDLNNDGERIHLTSWAEPPPLFNQPNRRKGDKVTKNLPPFA